MAIDEKLVQELLDKESIRELAYLYSRGVDRKDAALLRDIYTEDATDSHGDSYDGSAEGFVQFVEGSFGYMQFSAHNMCNHLISVNGDEGFGEVYGIAYHYLPDASRPGEWVEDVMCVRYIDNYRRCADGRWRFSKRVVTYDMLIQRPYSGRGGLLGSAVPDPSYAICVDPLFQPGKRH
jgi:ketosteroid isomerase-like protein